MFLSSKFFFAGADSHVKAPKSPLLLLLNSNGARKVAVKSFGVLPIFLDIPLLTVLERKKTRKSFLVWVAFTLIFISCIIDSSIKDNFLMLRTRWKEIVHTRVIMTHEYFTFRYLGWNVMGTPLICWLSGSRLTATMPVSKYITTRHLTTGGFRSSSHKWRMREFMSVSSALILPWLGDSGYL